jgi:hypothetical protein
MLAPDLRAVAVDLLRPPEGYRFDQAVLTTYSLDLETLLALPLAVLSQSGQGVDALLADPLLIVEGLREAGSRLHVFVDHDGLAIPAAQRELYSLLEPCVHPVAAPGGGAFHPKVWAIRFIDDAGGVRMRVAVLSRNLTFDRSWDLALVSEGVSERMRQKTDRKWKKKTRGLERLIAMLPDLATLDIPDHTRETVAEVASLLGRTAFPAPEGFWGAIEFVGLGMKGVHRRPWRPRDGASRVLAISPFVSHEPLGWLSSLGQRSVLVSRDVELDGLSEDPHESWDEVLVLADAAAEEADDESARRPSGLHAKAVVLEHGHDVTWWVGSANLTRAAWWGHNVEIMAGVTGRKGRDEGVSGQGVSRFLQSGFRDLCQPYVRTEVAVQDPETTAARQRLKEARNALREAQLWVRCVTEEDGWAWYLEGEFELPEMIVGWVWPVSRGESEAVVLSLPVRLPLPRASLTAFVAFHLAVPGSGADHVRLVRKLPAIGMPADRAHAVLRDLIQSPERLLRFLRALLGGLEGLVDSLGHGEGGAGGSWGQGIDADTLLEDLVRAASRDPSRLAPIRRILDDLQQTKEGRAIIPDGLLETWSAVEMALDGDDA